MRRLLALSLGLALLAGCALCLTGCPKNHPPTKPAAEMGAGEQVQQTTDAAATAQQAAEAAEAERLGKIAADSDAAAKAVDEDRKADAAGALGIQQAHLQGVERDAEEARKLAEAEQHRAEGRVAEAEKTLEDLRTDAKADAIALAELRRERDEAFKARDAAVEAYRIECENNMRRQQKAIDDALAAQKKAQDEQHNAMLKAQAEKLTWIGIGCISTAVASAFGLGIFGSIMVLRKFVVYLVALALIGFLFLGAAQIITQPWFMPVCAAAILGGCVWFGVWAWRHQKRGDLAQELQARTAKVAGVANTVVPILDAAYEQATEEVRAWLDANVFDKLSKLMNREEKQTVHEIRANQ